MINQENRVMLADSYKYSQPMQMPTGTTGMYDYLEARGGEYKDVTFFGLQYIMKKYFSTPITVQEVQEAKQWAEIHGEPFDEEGWMHIASYLQGMLPVRIKAIAEGTSVPTKIPMVTIESTDEKVYWVVSYLETLILKVWYPTTVATKSKTVKDMILKYLEETGTPESIGFKYHNFGDRGSTSVESAGIGGMAHMTQFLGTDNFNSLRYAKEFYSASIAGFSIPASEHSTVTSWSKDGEYDFFENYIEIFKDKPIIACVMDSYNIFKAVDYITKGKFKEKIESEDYPTFVIRPDSGNPVEILNSILNTMEDNSVAFTVNAKGYKVFNKYAIIWGDGVTPDIIEDMLKYVIFRGYSADVIAFGSGGDIMQNVNRDTSRFAVKCSSITVNGVQRDVFKDPITDQGKTSKKGRVASFWNNKTKEYFVGVDGKVYPDSIEVLETVFENGIFVKEYTFDEVRENGQNGQNGQK